MEEQLVSSIFGIFVLLVDGFPASHQHDRLLPKYLLMINSRRVSDEVESSAEKALMTFGCAGTIGASLSD